MGREFPQRDSSQSVSWSAGAATATSASELHEAGARSAVITPRTPGQPYDIHARIDRLPRSKHLLKIVSRIAAGGWFEFFELYMPGFISLGLVRAGIYTVENKGLFDYHSFASFLAAFFFGMFVSTAVFGFVLDRLGRRRVFVYSMIVYSIAQLCIALLADPLWIDLARFIAGLAVGMQLINNDCYVTELTPRASRGRYMAMTYIFVLSAIPVSALLAAILVPHDPLGFAGWRWVVAIGAVSGVLVFFIQRGLPESPRWLEAHGREAEADVIVAQIEQAVEEEHGKRLPPVDPAERGKVILAEHGRWQEMFDRFYLRRTLLMSVFQFSQTIAVFGFTSFVPLLLIKHGFSVVRSLDYTLLIVLMAPVGAAVGSFFSERVERKWQLVFCALLIGTAGSIFATASGVMVVVGAGACMALGNNWLITIFHPYAAELFPTRIRAQAIGFTFCWSRVSSMFVGYWVGDLMAAYGQSGVFVMIGLAMAAIILGVSLFGPKTNGISLETLSP
ncbi:putative MFS transporter [Paraburkholderia sp. GAS199]|uniref:MFS transporter n=1 Tax=Paraburkholderia sp. GAS199 TaxID=3035126 RepID=UPI003D1D0578